MKDNIQSTLLSEVPWAEDVDDFARQGTDAFSRHEIGLVRSTNWKVVAEDNEIPVYSVPVTRGGPHSFCSYDLRVENMSVKFQLQYSGSLRSIVILPEGLSIPYTIEDGKILFQVFEPCSLMVEVNGQYKTPLTISVNPPESFIPDKDDPNVIWFGPGIHRINRLNLNDNQVVYLENGAILQADRPFPSEEKLVEEDWAGRPNYRDFISAQKVKNIKVLGRGIIDTSNLDWHERRTILFDGCENVTITGITFNGAAHWTVLCNNCNGVKIENCKLYGYRENSDGIDIVNSSNVTVRNCFIRTGDDAVCVKSMLPPPRIGGENILVERCVVWNDKVRCFGIAGETMSDIHNVTFRNCDILRSFADWTREVGALCIITCDSGVISNIVFEDIRIRHEVNYAINCMIMIDKWSTDKKAGHVKNIVFRGIQIPPDVPIQIWGYDSEHLVEDVLLENISIYSENGKVESNSLIEKNRYTKRIVLA